MRAAELLVKCLEKEKVKYVFGLPGEEVLSLLDALSDSDIQFIATRHEQGAAFMANVIGRLTGKAGVCLATLGPGATNLMTGVADALLDASPLVAITGQTDLSKTHKQAHQYIDIREMFRPITKWNSRITRPEAIPEIVRWAFKVAESEKPGATHLELSEDVASSDVVGEPIEPTPVSYPAPNPESVLQAAKLIEKAAHPMIIAGNGVIRRRASAELAALAKKVHLAVTNTFQGKGCVDYNEPYALPTVGMHQRDWVMCGLERADVVITVGYDQVEYEPCLWNPEKDKKIIHIDTLPSDVDEHYLPQVEIVGEIRQSLAALAEACNFTRDYAGISSLREFLSGELNQYRQDTSMPMKPQKVLADIRQVLDKDDILLTDVGANKVWTARMFPARSPNSVLISNGFASMGFALPGAIAAKLVYPQRRVVAVAGDGGFLMVSHELETAKRLGVAFAVVVWVDNSYGLIEWKQINAFGRAYGVRITNPDFAALAKAYGLPGFKIEAAQDFQDTLRHALTLNAPSVIEVPIDYSENLRLTEKLGHLVCPV
ncbi:MAG: acetolactate synthase large subunit [Chloroflexi bacterium]|nr:acetolactate synthase large subunit [Chloroflexota bacterium]